MVAVMPGLQQAFDELESFIANYDPIALLSQLTLTFLFHPEDKFQGESSEIVSWQRRIELLAGYLLVRPYPPGRTARVDGNVLERVDKLLERYFAVIERQMLAEVTRTKDISQEAAMVLAEAKIESYYVRGDAYPHQFYDFAQDLYGPHDAWFHEHYGFTIAEGIDLSKAIHREYAKRFNRSIREARKEARRQTDDLVASQEIVDGERRDVETRIGCALHFGRSEMLLAFTPEGLAQFSGAPIGTCHGFLRRMSQEFGYRNPSFPGSFTDPAAAPWDYNTLHER